MSIENISINLARNKIRISHLTLSHTVKKRIEEKRKEHENLHVSVKTTYSMDVSAAICALHH